MEPCPVCGHEPCTCDFMPEELAEAARALTPEELAEFERIRALRDRGGKQLH